MYFKWTREAIEELVEYRNMGLPLKEISEIMECSIDSVKQKSSQLLKEGIIAPYKSKGGSLTRNWTKLEDEELIQSIICGFEPDLLNRTKAAINCRKTHLREQIINASENQ